MSSPLNNKKPSQTKLSTMSNATLPPELLPRHCTLDKNDNAAVLSMNFNGCYGEGGSNGFFLLRIVVWWCECDFGSFFGWWLVVGVVCLLELHKRVKFPIRSQESNNCFVTQDWLIVVASHTADIVEVGLVLMLFCVAL
jgi:hypothetical protein